jgi:hypothetical protein
MRGIAGGIQGGGKIDDPKPDVVQFAIFAFRAKIADIMVSNGDSRNFIDDARDQGSIWKDVSNIAGELVKPL